MFKKESCVRAPKKPIFVSPQPCAFLFGKNKSCLPFTRMLHNAIFTSRITLNTTLKKECALRLKNMLPSPRQLTTLSLNCQPKPSSVFVMPILQALMYCVQNTKMLGPIFGKALISSLKATTLHSKVSVLIFSICIKPIPVKMPN